MRTFLTVLGVLISIPVCIGVFLVSVLLVLAFVAWVADFLFGGEPTYREDEE
ncbi:MAG: hypothetical protein IJ042_05930 [Butyricicoccus sp.]|nr:hypothetical protein [Butyricicoccus sp.]